MWGYCGRYVGLLCGSARAARVARLLLLCDIIEFCRSQGAILPDTLA